MQISLRAARVNAGMTINEVAKLLHVSNATVSNWEKGVTPIPMIRYKELCGIYNVEEDYIQVPHIGDEIFE